MRSPAAMDIIQLDLNNSCQKKCSNCTRLISHQSKKWEMDLPTFERAVKSMEGWGGQGTVLGLIGGEVTLHSQFERIARTMADLWGGPLTGNGRKPIADFDQFAKERLYDRSNGRGLWTSLGAGFYRHLETITEVFSHWNVNDHQDRPGLHQANLISRKEYCKATGTTDDEWLAARDKCWVQNMWSASINPHGAYPCEQMAAIDALYFDGAHAWPVEQGWWQRQPEDFGNMLELCNYCSLAQKGPSQVDHEEKDIICQLNVERLTLAGSPAVAKGRYEAYDPEVHTEKRQVTTKASYLETDRRVSMDNDSMKPQRVACVVVCVGYADKLKLTLQHNAELVDQLVVVTAGDDNETSSLVAYWRDKFQSIKIVCSYRCYDDNHAFNKGKMLNDGLAALDRPDWVILTDADVFLNQDLKTYLAGHAINPGCLYGTNRLDGTMLNGRFFRDHDRPSGVNAEPNGFFQLFNRRALAVRDRWPKVMSEEFCSAGGVDSWFLQQFPEDKRVMIPEIPVCHISHAEFGEHWNGSDKGRKWRQVAMITTSGTKWLIDQEQVEKLWAKGAVDGKTPFGVLRLVDTLDGRVAEIGLVRGRPFSRDIVRIENGNLFFQGKNIGHHHIHVAAFLEG